MLNETEVGWRSKPFSDSTQVSQIEDDDRTTINVDCIREPESNLRRLAEDHGDPVHVEPVGGYVGLLQQMNPKRVHFSDEDYDEGEEDDNGDGEATAHGSNSTGKRNSKSEN
ncbi:hypothetical protein L1887_03445 [Cichorium endivia]|nr:hypothetical protein L1887_03445 [Cichorium endivia]